jgi:UDP-3-O-[3-hydroxymyristoyl] glucosamine N-acyltransferase
MLDKGPGFASGIHPTAYIHETAVLGSDVSVGPFAVIGNGVRIGAGSVIGPQCHIGEDTVVGEAAQLRDGVRIGARVNIGARFICQPGAVIGADGFSFVTPEQSAVERARGSLGDQGEISAQSWARIHSLGAVTIGDDCEVGANSCIDRGTVRDTRLGNGTKLDNLVQVGHNAVIGDHCLLCAQVGVAGSTKIGNNVVLGGQTGIGDNLFIGDNVITGGGTKVLANVPSGRVMLGYPAVQMHKHIDIYKAMRRLPRLFRDVAAMQKSVSKTDENG